MLSMPGPQFLLVFAVFSLIVILAVTHAIARVESSLTNNPKIRDPFDIAYLRGGLTELVRVTALALTLRGLLKVEAERLVVTSKANFEAGPVIEQEVLRACRSPQKPAKIEDDTRVKAAATPHRARLLQQGLLANAQIFRLRWPPVLAGLVVLLALAAAKMYVALGAGHRNIGFLAMLCMLDCVILVSRVRRRRTRAGDEALFDLGTLFARLKSRRSSLSVGAESDATMLAAVYGGVAGSGIDQAAWRRMFTRQDSSSSSSSGCGSSCGGGGGCGGGGCGGCGS